MLKRTTFMQAVQTACMGSPRVNCSCQPMLVGERSDCRKHAGQDAGQERAGDLHMLRATLHAQQGGVDSLHGEHTGDCS